MQMMGRFKTHDKSTQSEVPVISAKTAKSLPRPHLPCSTAITPSPAAMATENTLGRAQSRGLEQEGDQITGRPSGPAHPTRPGLSVTSQLLHWPHTHFPGILSFHAHPPPTWSSSGSFCVAAAEPDQTPLPGLSVHLSAGILGWGGALDSRGSDFLCTEQGRSPRKSHREVKAVASCQPFCLQLSRICRRHLTHIK